MPNTLTYIDAVAFVLKESKQALTDKEIFDQIYERELVDNIRKIPFNSVKALIRRDIEKSVTNSSFELVNETRYRLREEFSDKTRSPHLSPSLADDEVVAEESILVCEARLLDTLGPIHGIDRDYKKYMDFLFQNGKLQFKSKKQMEVDEGYRQIVSYVIVRCKGKLLRFTRNDAKINTDQKYLDGKYSIGFGGHVQQLDYDMFSNYTVYENSVRRELREEICIKLQDSNTNIQTIGVLQDTSTPLGRRHIAFIHLLDLERPIFRRGEEVVEDLRLVSFQDISNDFGSYEYWSKLCLETYFAEQLSTTTYICPNNEFTLRNHHQYLSMVGAIGSGKSQACTILEKEFGYERIPVSTILRGLMNCPPMEEIGRKKMQDLGQAFIEDANTNAHEMLANSVIEYMQSHPAERYIIDGLRYPETQDAIEKLLGTSITTIYVQNTIDYQYKFYQARQSKEIEFAEFREISSHPVEKNIPLFFPRSEIVIYNNSSSQSFVSALEKFFNSELTDQFFQEAWDVNAGKRHQQLVSGTDLTFWEVVLPSITQCIKQHNDHKSYSVLDVGCGTGVLSYNLANYVQDLTGIDSSPVSIDIAREYCQSLSNVSFRCSAVEEYKEEKKYHIVLANMTLQATKSLVECLTNINHLLEKGGSFIFTIPHPIFYPMRKRQLFPRRSYQYEKASFYKIAFTIRNDPYPLPSLIPYFHRPLADYFTALRKAGFSVQEFLEPMPNEQDLAHHPKSEWRLPHFVLMTCQKMN